MEKTLKIDSIVDALKEDHKNLKKFIEIMKSDVEQREKRGAYLQFVSLLKSHASSEEKAVYTPCLANEDLSIEAHEGFVEHKVANSLIQSIDKTREKEEWTAKVKVLAELVEHHIDEEESELLPKVAKKFESDAKKEMVVDFVSLRERSQKDVTQENAGVLAS